MKTIQQDKFIPHFENIVWSYGKTGAIEAIKTIKRYVENKEGFLAPKVDGAPAILCGVDPHDGKYFVAIKKIFNKTPIVYKSPQEIEEAFTDENLKQKLLVAFREFKKYNIDHYVYHGDFLFGPADNGDENAFHPNVIQYFINKGYHSCNENCLKTKHRVGVFWHSKWKWDIQLNKLVKIPFNRLNMDQAPDTVLDICSDTWLRPVSWFVWIDILDFIEEIESKIVFLKDIFDQVDDKVWIRIKTWYNNHGDDGFESLNTYIINFYNVNNNPSESKKVHDAIQSYSNTLSEMYVFAELFKKLKNRFLQWCSQVHVEQKYNASVIYNNGQKVTLPTGEGFVLSNADSTFTFKLVDKKLFTSANKSHTVKRGWDF